jgi:hypothetical protein
MFITFLVNWKFDSGANGMTEEDYEITQYVSQCLTPDRKHLRSKEVCMRVLGRYFRKMLNLYGVCIHELGAMVNE